MRQTMVASLQDEFTLPAMTPLRSLHPPRSLRQPVGVTSKLGLVTSAMFALRISCPTIAGLADAEGNLATGEIQRLVLDLRSNWRSGRAGA